MKHINKFFLFVLFISAVALTSCNRNYYSGGGKGGKNCGCPSHKGMTGY